MKGQNMSKVIIRQDDFDYYADFINGDGELFESKRITNREYDGLSQIIDFLPDPQEFEAEQLYTDVSENVYFEPDEDGFDETNFEIILSDLLKQK